MLIKISVSAVLFVVSIVQVFSQSIPEEYRKEPIPGQLEYLEDHTRVYENFRAIREDIFQLIARNVNDSLNGAKRKINNLNAQTNMLNSRIDSLNVSLQATNDELNKMTRTKNSISVLGLNVNKNTYNSIMWSILGILIFLLVVGYLTFKQNRITTLKTKKELVDLTDEFEEYKKKTRIEREKTTMEHFNEIKKLKASLPGGRG